ncbi:MAG: signal peptidase I [Clostridia bacterium]|nr:signal peptidase I [Clostridia bacterium]
MNLFESNTDKNEKEELSVQTAEATDDLPESEKNNSTDTFEELDACEESLPTEPLDKEFAVQDTLSDNSDEAFSSDDEASPTEESAKSSNEQPKEGILHFIFDTVELVAISLVLVMIILAVFARHSPVNGSSMYPTILGKSEGSASETIGEDVLLISNLFYTPEKGDIVVIQTPTVKSGIAASLEHPIVKRIIATEHDRVEIDFVNWRITINGEVYEDGLNSASYVHYDGSTLVDGKPNRPMVGFYSSVIMALKNDERCDYKEDGTVHSFTIPEGQVFVLGDNRNNSKDSRAIGLIDERWILGKSILRVYPFDRIGVVD